MTDPIADMLTRIRNAQSIGFKTVDIPYSKVKEAIAKVLLDEGYILTVLVRKDSEVRSTLVLELKYYEGRKVIERIARVSKPGKRVYSSCKAIQRVLGGYGIVILSTPLGIMSDKTARKENVGGEVICEVF